MQNLHGPVRSMGAREALGVRRASLTERFARGVPLTLGVIKTVHTVVWALFAGCVVSVPALAWRGDVRAATVVIGVVMVEVVILAVNRGHCPLTPLAARYTADRRDNFDIFLPVWLARYNKVIFGSLYLAGIAITVARWRGWLP
jgi:hypothetical protein